jgi:hypothetical protein
VLEVSIHVKFMCNMCVAFTYLECSHVLDEQIMRMGISCNKVWQHIFNEVDEGFRSWIGVILS